jgi:lysyl-tRNA synthetase class 2
MSGSILLDYAHHEGKIVTVAGRLMSIRKHGGLTFGRVQDQSGSLQLYISRQNLAPFEPPRSLGYENLKLIDVGDFVEATGIVAKTEAGEISVRVSSLRPLTKSLRPLPDKWAGIKDRETILRRRYLDTTMVPENRRTFESISRMLYAIRTFLNDRGFVEFLTPVIQPQYGGGSAKPFLTFVNALSSKMYLSISHELYLKRLIAAGFEKVYTIGRYFRNEGIDRSHQPEFSMLETMTAYANYEDNMDLIEALFQHVAVQAFGRTRFKIRGNEIDFSGAWKRVSMLDAIKDVTGVDFLGIATLEKANEAVKSIGIGDQLTIGDAILTIFETAVQPTLISPTLVFGHPAAVSPLAKPMESNPAFAERFELFIAGMECSENWSEQNDPVQLLQRWKEAREGDDEAHPLDYDFIETLEYGMPPTTGLGPGIERMAMLFTEQDNIDDVVFFPMMRPAISRDNQVIFGAKDLKQVPIEDEVVTIHIDEFEILLSEGLLTLQRGNLVIRPYLHQWLPGLDRGVWRSSGYVKIEGLLASSELLVAGYTSRSETPPVPSDEVRAFLDVLEVAVLEPLRTRFAGCIIELAEVSEGENAMTDGVVRR